MAEPNNLGDQTFLGASGEMARRMARHNWSATGVGPPETWPLSLQTIVRVALRSRFAMWLAWGEDLTFFCNDAYLPTLGIKQDWALGASARQVWREIWPEIGPRIDAVLEHGISTWDEGLLLYLERSGAREETYHTFSYSPLSGDDGNSRGMLCVVAEETERVVGERRMSLLRDLAASFSAVTAEADLFTVLEQQLSGDRQLIPFSITLLMDEDKKGFSVRAQTGVTNEQLARTASQAGRNWAVEALLAGGDAPMLMSVPANFGALPTSLGKRQPTQALMLPIVRQGGGQGVGSEHLIGAFVVGLNPDRPFDRTYSDFLKLLVGQVAAALTSARVYDFERQRADQLAELDSAKTQFFSNVSHEFRTPLTLMLGPFEEALRSPERTLAGEQLELAHRNALRLRKLVNTLLDFSLIEAGRLDSNFEPVDLATFTGELASLFRSAADRSGLRLIVQCPVLPQPVWVDREMWEKIVLNLLSNAYKFTFEGSITISLVAEASDVVLKVRDTGVGIPASDLPQVFDRFKRVKGARGRTHEGTGIGLALVRELVKLHGGVVSVSSEAGVGTEFTVSIPITQRPSLLSPQTTREQVGPISQPALTYVSEAERWSSPAEKSLPALLYGSPNSQVSSDRADSRPQIILADDNADMRDYIQRLLSERFNVLAVADGLEALEAIQANPPDLVLSDVMMPRLDGFGLLQALRAEPATASIPLLLLSARAGEEARVEGLDKGADDYLIKPFTALELIARVSSVLTLARTRRDAMRMEAKLKADRDNILESIDEGFITIAPNWRITYVNRAAEKLLDSPRAQLLGADIWQVYAMDGTPYAEQLRQSMREQTPAVLENYYQPWRRWYEISIYPADESGLNIYFRDVTSKKELVLALQDADRRKDEFLATLAHELRNPLAPIRSAADVLSSPEIGSREIAWTSSIIQRQVQHMARLLDDLLDLSRITSGKMEIKRDPVALDSVIDTALEAVQPLIEARGHRLEVRRPEGDYRLEGDSVRLAQVLSNLLTNAAKYTDVGGEIFLSATVSGDELLLEISDSGIGLTSEQIERVFEMFSQVQSSNSRSEGGLGIGLTLVRRIVELHGGTIVAESPGLGLGSRFRIRLPIVTSRSVPLPEAPARQPAASKKSRRVLIVDDNRDAAESLALLLQIDGHQVQTVYTGQDAILAIQHCQPDIAFLDIGLPDLSGYDVARAVRDRNGEQIKLVAVTGWGQAEDKQQATNAGFDLHVVKPANPDRLRELLEGLPC